MCVPIYTVHTNSMQGSSSQKFMLYIVPYVHMSYYAFQVKELEVGSKHVVEEGFQLRSNFP